MNIIILTDRPTNGRPRQLGGIKVQGGKILRYVGDDPEQGSRIYMPFEMAEKFIESCDRNYSFEIKVKRSKKLLDYFYKYTAKSREMIEAELREKIYKEIDAKDY